jgi:F-type H+-transporting ATPase subunit epsilon
MSEKFNLEIISPDQMLFNSEVEEVVIPAHEGIMTILKNHISLITFLRPGFIEIVTDNKNKKFYVEDGTVEFFNNRLLILSSFSIQIEQLSKETAEKMIESSKVLLQNSEINDKTKHILNYKISSLQEIN